MAFTGVGLGYGAKIRIGRGSTPVWTQILGPGDFDLPNGERQRIDVTSHSSPDGRMEYISGLIDTGTFSVPVDWIPDSPQDVLLFELYTSVPAELIQLEITPAGGTAEVYAAEVTNYARSAPVNGKATATATFSLNGLVSGGPELAGP